MESRRLRLWLASLGIALLVGCTQQMSSDACHARTSLVRGIRNGENGDRCQYGFVVRVDIDAQNADALCSGVLVSKNAVLTAAHCFLDGSLGTVNKAAVTTSALSRESSPGVAYRTHPSFTFSNFDSPDLALVYLEKDLTQTPVNMAGANAPIGTAVTALGYGLDGIGVDGDGDSGAFLEGDLIVIDGKNPAVGCGTSKSICAYGGGGEKNQETCEGDSGGPLLNGTQLLGILSGGNFLAGDATCRGSVNSIYTSVVDESAWIQAQLQAGSTGATALQH